MEERKSRALRRSIRQARHHNLSKLNPHRLDEADEASRIPFLSWTTLFMFRVQHRRVFGVAALPTRCLTHGSRSRNLQTPIAQNVYRHPILHILNDLCSVLQGPLGSALPEYLVIRNAFDHEVSSPIIALEAIRSHQQLTFLEPTEDIQSLVAYHLLNQLSLASE